MGKTVLRAKIRTEKWVNEGHIIIDGDKKEGIFGNDFVQIENDDNCIYLNYHEYNYDLSEEKPRFFYTSTTYSNDSHYNTELYCPEQYLFLSGKNGISLTLICKEQDRNKIRRAIKYLDKAKSNV